LVKGDGPWLFFGRKAGSPSLILEAGSVTGQLEEAGGRGLSVDLEGGDGKGAPHHDERLFYTAVPVFLGKGLTGTPFLGG